MPEALDIAEDESVRGYDDLDKQHSDRKKKQKNMQALELCFFAQEPV